jgi:curved DNA-binding protein
MEGHNGGQTEICILRLLFLKTYLKRSGDDLKTTVNIDMYTALLGEMLR